MPPRIDAKDPKAPSLSRIQDAVKSVSQSKKKSTKIVSATVKKTASSGTASTSKHGDVNSELLDAIRALGGGDDDFDLVKDLDDGTDDDLQEFSDREENVCPNSILLLSLSTICRNSLEMAIDTCLLFVESLASYNRPKLRKILLSF